MYSIKILNIFMLNFRSIKINTIYRNTYKGGTKMIDEFQGKYGFLSNFYDSEIEIEYDGLKFESVEAAYQAQKCMRRSEKEKFTKLNPSESKRLGRKVYLQPDWDKIKAGIMYELVKIKFTTHEDLKEKLLETGDQELIEGNWWHDNFFGKCTCLECKKKEQRNELGKILMKVRKEIQNN